MRSGRTVLPVRPNQRGVTLIEMVIAITLVALLSTGLLVATRTSLQTEERVEARLTQNHRALNAQQIVSSQLANAMPIVGHCAVGPALTPAIPFFNGSESWLRFATSYSIAEGTRGYPRIVEYQIQPSGGGLLALIVTEYPYTGPASTAPFCAAMKPVPVTPVNPAFVVQSQQAGGSNQWLAATGLRSAGFAYHERYAPYSFRETPWLAEWTRPALPAGVRVSLVPGPAAMQMPLLGFTVALTADRNVMGQYVDREF